MLKEGHVQHRLRKKGDEVEGLLEHECAGLVAAGFAEVVTKDTETATAAPARTATNEPTGKGRARAPAGAKG